MTQSSARGELLQRQYAGASLAGNDSHDASSTLSRPSLSLPSASFLGLAFGLSVGEFGGLPGVCVSLGLGLSVLSWRLVMGSGDAKGVPVEKPRLSQTAV